MNLRVYDTYIALVVCVAGGSRYQPGSGAGLGTPSGGGVGADPFTGTVCHIMCFTIMQPISYRLGAEYFVLCMCTV